MVVRRGEERRGCVKENKRRGINSGEGGGVTVTDRGAN